MKVKDLIKQLKSVDPERIVILAKDAEGNSYSPLADFWEGAYRAETTWHGEAQYEALTSDLEAQGYVEEDIITDGEKAVIFCPIN